MGIRACLKSAWQIRSLKEGTVFQLLRSGKTSAETISLVARQPRWQSRPNIREAILTNPKTPLVWFHLWLPAMKIPEIKRLITSNRLSSVQKKAVEERLKSRWLRLKVKG